MASLISEAYLSPTLPLLAILVTVLSIWGIRFYRRFQKIVKQIEKIPGPPVPNPLTGHLQLFRKTADTPSTLDWFQKIFTTFVGITRLYQEKNEGIMRVWVGPTQPVVIIFDAELAEVLLTSNTNIDKSGEYDFAIPWLGLGLFTSTGDRWRGHRKMLTPAFHFRILESFVPIINKQQIIMMKVIDEMQSKNNGVIDDIRPLITNCALDIICETAMGVSIEAQTDPDSKYSKAVRKVLDLFTLRFLNPLLWNEYIFALTPTGYEQRKTIKYLHDFTDGVIKRKKAEILQRMSNSKDSGTIEETMSDIGTKRVLAFLDNLLTQNIKNPEQFTEKDVRAEVDTFMSAGQDTSSATVQFSLQLIGHYPEVQAKIHEELDGIYGNDPTRDIKFEDLRHMKYLEKCIKEALRIYPPVLFIARKITEEFKIKSYTIPEGTNCMVLFYQLHRDPKYFPNPEVYDPERFSQENTNTRHAFAYTPFSAGPRNCIGQRFALQTVKALLASILRKYKITSLVPLDKVELAIGTTMGPKNKITLKFEERVK